MRTAIKLILLNLLIAQIIAPILVMIPCVIYLVATTGNLDKDALITMLMIPAQLAGQLMMGVYLWKAGYISTKKTTWSPVSSSYLFFSALTVLTCGFVVSALTELMDWIPNIMEQSFDILQSGWGGILAIAIIGPVLEELLFRGAITKALLQQYSPTKAILLSALLFGVFHINPLSVFLSIKYPEAENMSDLMNTSTYLMVIFAAVLILAGVIWGMRRTTIPYPWKEETNITD